MISVGEQFGPQIIITSTIEEPSNNNTDEIVRDDDLDDPAQADQVYLLDNHLEQSGDEKVQVTEDQSPNTDSSVSQDRDGCIQQTSCNKVRITFPDLNATYVSVDSLLLLKV